MILEPTKKVAPFKQTETDAAKLPRDTNLPLCQVTPYFVSSTPDVANMPQRKSTPVLAFKFAFPWRILRHCLQADFVLSDDDCTKSLAMILSVGCPFCRREVISNFLSFLTGGTVFSYFFLVTRGGECIIDDLSLFICTICAWKYQRSEKEDIAIAKLNTKQLSHVTNGHKTYFTAVDGLSLLEKCMLG